MSVHYADDTIELRHGDALDELRTMDARSVECCVTSPPYYGLRDYGEPGQYGLEPTPAEYVETMRTLFAELRRVLADDGTFWLNIGDSYNAYNGNRGPSTSGLRPRSAAPNLPGGSGLRADLAPKNLLGIPWRVAFALQDDGWILRNDIIWHKPNGMPESIRDRMTAKHEHIFMFSKSPRYWFDVDAIAVERGDKMPTPSVTQKHVARGDARVAHNEQSVWTTGVYKTERKNPGDVWKIATQPFAGAHFAAYPIEIPRRAIAAGCKPGGTVLDPFNGSGTTGLAAGQLGRRYVGIDLSAEYLELSLSTRLAQGTLLDEAGA